MSGLRGVLAALLLIQFVGFSIAFAAPAPVSSPSPSVSPSPSPSPSTVAEVLNAQLQAAVQNSVSQLPPLDPMQKRIFDEEVVPHYLLFIRDYQQAGQQVNAAVDLDGIKSIIRFSAQGTLHEPDAKILLYLNSQNDCSNCMAAAADVRKTMELRVQRRGLSPVWIQPEELAAADIGDLVGPRGTVGYMEVDLSQAPDDADGNTRYLEKVQLQVRGIASYQDQDLVFDTDNLETETQKLLTRAFIELGSKADISGLNAAKDEILLRVSKIADFAQYNQLWTELGDKFKNIALISQRKVWREHAVFAIKSKQTPDQIKALVQNISLDGNKQAVVTGSKDQTIQMEIH